MGLMTLIRGYLVKSTLGLEQISQLVSRD